MVGVKCPCPCQLATALGPWGPLSSPCPWLLNLRSYNGVQALSTLQSSGSLTLGWESFSSFKDSADYIGSTLIIQENLPISRTITLITSAKPFCCVRSHIHRFWDQNVDISGGLILPVVEGNISQIKAH